MKERKGKERELNYLLVYIHNNKPLKAFGSELNGQ
jgi:hypothetical protein